MIVKSPWGIKRDLAKENKKDWSSPGAYLKFKTWSNNHGNCGQDCGFFPTVPRSARRKGRKAVWETDENCGCTAVRMKGGQTVLGRRWGCLWVNCTSNQSMWPGIRGREQGNRHKKQIRELRIFKRPMLGKVWWKYERLRRPGKLWFLGPRLLRGNDSRWWESPVGGLSLWSLKFREVKFCRVWEDSGVWDSIHGLFKKLRGRQGFILVVERSRITVLVSWVGLQE